MITDKTKGFSLLEIMLVLAIVSSLVALMLNYTTQKSDELRRDKTTVQVQQILNAGLSFFTNHSYWPLKNATTSANLCAKTASDATWTNLDDLQSTANPYLPASLTTNSYANNYQISCNSVNGFYVQTTVDKPTNALIIAGRLPLAYITTPASISSKLPPDQPAVCKSSPYTGCTTVVSTVNIPGQNLNNARSVNYAGVFYSGSCVPAPACPPGMKPDILVSVGSVSGVYDNPSCSSPANAYPYDPTPGCTANVYPLSSFSAFARGDVNGDPISPNSPGPYDCQAASAGVMTAQKCWKTYENLGVPTYFPDDGTTYWRVCLAVLTERGQVTYSSSTNYTQKGKMMGSLVAFTRCVPNSGNENPGGSVNVYQQNVGFAP